MLLDFAATESGFDNGLGGASNAPGDGDQHYVLFRKDGDGVYFEFDDQIHGGFDQVAQVSVQPDRVVFGLRDSNVITVRRQMDDAPWSEFIEGVRRTFPPALVAVAYSEQYRPLTSEQYALLRFMLEHADERAATFVTQLDRVRVTPWRCPCGCASFNMVVEGMPEPSGGMEVLVDFTFGPPDQLCGIFPFAQNGVLAGVEVVGYAVDAPKQLPKIGSLVVAG